MTIASVAMRGLGLVGTLALTHFLSPEVMGEASAAWILVMTGPTLLTPNIGSYLVTHTRGRPGVAFHGLVLHVAINVIAVGLVVVFAAPLTGRAGVPAAVALIPAFAIATLLDSVAFVPERMLEREMEFGKLARARTAGDAVYTVLSITLAAFGAGGFAIAFANVGRSAIKACIAGLAAPAVHWLAPHPLRSATLLQLVRFGIPLTIANVAIFAARRWDNLIISRFYGAATLGHYNLAYNLAEIPAIQVGEQVSDVLLSSFSRFDAAQRKAGLVRATGLTALVIFPLAAGIGAVSETVIKTLMPNAWLAVAPMLAVLSCISIARPVGDTVHAYLLAQGRTRPVMWLALLQLVLVGITLLTLGRISTLFACLAIVLAFAVTTVAAAWTAHLADGGLFFPLLRACAGPLFACGPLVAAVLGVRSIGGAPPIVQLIAEIVAGAIAYSATALLVAPGPARDLRTLASRAKIHPEHD